MAELRRREGEKKIKGILQEYVSELEKAERIKKKLHPDAQLLIAEKDKIKTLIQMPGFERIIFDKLNIEGINQLLTGCVKLAKNYELASYEGLKGVRIVEDEQLYELQPVLTGSTGLSGNKIEEGRQVLFQLRSEKKYEKRKGESIYPVWNRYREEGKEQKAYNSFTDNVKDIADDNNWDRGFLFAKQGQYKVSADIYKKDRNGTVELLEHHEYDVKVEEAAYSEVVNLTEIGKIGKAIRYSDFSEQIPNLAVTAGLILASSAVLGILSKFKVDKVLKILAPVLKWIGFAGDVVEFGTAIGLMYNFIEMAVTAKTEEGLKDAGKVFSQAAVAMGLAVLFKFLEWSSCKSTVEDVRNAEKGKEIVNKTGIGMADNFTIINGKVDGKIPVVEYTEYRIRSIINPESDTMTLGKFRPSKDASGKENWSIPGADSYTVKAGETTYFSLGDDWNKISKKYGFDEKGQDMFKYFNCPALDDAVKGGKTIRFSHDPRLPEYRESALRMEWDYLQEKHNFEDLYEEGGFWYAY